MTRETSPWTFLCAVAAFCAVGAAGVAAINYVQDPYLLFDRPRSAGVNAVKPAAETHERMMKSYQMQRVAARTVVLGSSRTDIGIDPGSTAWPEAMRPVYNLSVVGAGLRTNLLYLQQLDAPSMRASQAAAPRRTVLVGLDFESFLHRPATAPARGGAHVSSPGPDEEQQRLDDIAAGRRLPGSQWLKDHVAGLLTLDALGDSLATLRASLAERPSPDLEATGRLSEGRLRQWTASDGVEALFAQKNLQTVRQYLVHRHELSQAPNAPMRELQVLHALIDHARKHDLALIFALQPSHASRLELLDQMGYWPDFERWKRELTQAIAQARGSGANVTLWDFAGFEAPIQEALPAPGASRHPMKWFWDPVHYSTALGDVMVRNMLGEAAPGFGARLEPGTVEARLQQVREQRREHRLQHPEVSAQARALLCKAGRCAEPRSP